jgi:hypothetical protein
LQKYKSLKFFVVVFILLQGILVAQNTVPISDALLVFEEENYDFGEVSNDTVLTHIFKFQNTGTDTLFIKGVRGSWGCTASLLSSEVIPPKASGELRVSFSTKNRQGINRKTIYINSNDKKSQIKKIYVRAYIRVNKSNT